MKVEYINHYGNDDMVVDAARVSFHKEASNYSPEQNAKLIKYLATHEHIAPFFHPQITVRETVPIFIARQRFKHTVGFSYSEVSRRYVDDTPEFYIPDVWRKRADNVKQGSSDEPVDIIRICSEYEKYPHDLYEEAVEACMYAYRALLDGGVAPEQARMVLPQSMYTSYYCTGSLYAFARAYKQRSDAHAQKEIQELAAGWNEIISPLFPHSWKALTE